MTDTPDALSPPVSPTPPRVNVAMIPKTSAALTALERATDLSKTDLVNRAIQLYEYLLPYLDGDADRAVMLRDGGELSRLRVF